MEENNAPETIQLPEINETQEFSVFWLRDNCRCEDCYNNITKQRNVDITLLPRSSFTCQYLIRDNKLHLSWGDGHKSEFDFHFLKQFCRLEARPDIILWNGNEVEKSISKISAGECQKEGKKQIVNSILQHGVAVVTDVEPSLSATQNVIEAIAPIYHTFFGGMWEVGDSLEHSDTAYTKSDIGPHTDNTYLNDPAGLQIFHCLRHDGEGGETTLIDGFNAAMQLKSTDEHSYRILSETKIECEFIDSDKHHTATSSVLNHRWGTAELEQIRFNCYDRSPRFPINTSDVNAFYAAIIKFARIIKRPENQWKMKLGPGDVIFMNNWRVLHGRTAYTGSRKMVGAYVSMGEFLSKARVLKLIV